MVKSESVAGKIQSWQLLKPIKASSKFAINHNFMIRCS